jgi:PAS domain S-box-containing protein
MRLTIPALWRLSQVTALATALAGSLAFVASILGVPVASPAEGSAFALLGTSLWLALTAPAVAAPAMRRTLGQVCALAAASVGLGSLFTVRQLAGPAIAPASAIALVCLGIALLVREVPLRGGKHPSQYLALVASLVAFIALLGHGYDAPELVGPVNAPFSPVSALLVLILASGVLASRPEGGLAGLIARDDGAGVLARRMLLASLVVPAVVGWLGLRGVRLHWFGLETGLAVTLLACVVLFFALVLLTSLSLRRSDVQRLETMAVLRQSEERFRQLAENVRDVFWMLDPATGAVLYVSPSYEAIWGRPAQSLYHHPESWTEAIHEEDRARSLLALRAVRLQGSCDVQFRVVQPGGAMRVVRLRGFGVHDPGGAIYRIAGVAEDVTDSVVSAGYERAQLTRIDLLNQIARAIVDRDDMGSVLAAVALRVEPELPADFAWVATCDVGGAELTTAALGLSSWTAADDLGLLPGQSVLVENAGMQACLRDGAMLDVEDSALAEAPLLRGLHILGLRSVVATPLRVGDQPLGVLVVARRPPNAFTSAEVEFLRTLGEHVALAAHHAHLYDTLQRAYDDLRATQQAITQQERLQALGQMASGIAHDINNALSPIVGYADLLQATEQGISRAGLNYLKTISMAAEDVAHIVGQLRDFYRQREPTQALQVVDLNRIVTQVVDMTRARWRDMPQQHGIVVDVQVDLLPELPLVRGIESELREALTNLMFNAVDAMPEGGVLTLRTRAHGAQVAVEVQDSGVGMDAETLRRCLEPFFTTKGERGTGLGLAMVFGVMTRHEGDIQVESDKGVGSTFRLLFPMAPPDLDDGNDTEPAGLPILQAPLRVLCIDDEPMLRGLLQELLARDGHQVEVADGARRGLAAFLRARGEPRPFDVVVTDLGMPYIDGLEVARMVKAAAPQTGVVLLSGWGANGPDPLPPHVDVALAKPPKLRLLREALRKAVKPTQ